MERKELTCIECPVGCQIEVELDGGKVVSVKGNSCPRGKMYAENEVVCPKRVVTSTIKTDRGELVPVKTDKPIEKYKMFDVMGIINERICKAPIKIGDILIENICGDANLIATGNSTK